MKTVKLFLVSLLLALPLLGQAQQELFKKYSDRKNVSSVYISKAMLDMNPSLFTKDIYIGKAASQLNSVQIISTLDNKIKPDLLKDIRELVKSSRYELLMKQKGIVSSSEFYVSRKGDKVKELVMVINGAASLKFVYLEGEMTTKDVQNILLYQNTSNYVSPARVYQLDNLQAMDIQMPDIDLKDLQQAFNSDEWKQFVEDMKKLGDDMKSLRD
ncbi:DUF4252 domain-containing protein [Mediterranea massiliensis]|uniref:DUF4252 domain-containing protein n=1 Tax=Mediterranea massiliensis TaxID=1841865 RepID=UPI0023F0F823|nr:DUF4252 domain-containing protein [Mediterranea massiliensis]